MSSSIYTAHCVLKTKEEIETFPAKYIATTPKAAGAGLMREGIIFISNLSTVARCNTDLSLRLLYAFRTCMQAGRPGGVAGYPRACYRSIS